MNEMLRLRTTALDDIKKNEQKKRFIVEIKLQFKVFYGTFVVWNVCSY